MCYRQNPYKTLPPQPSFLLWTSQRNGKASSGSAAHLHGHGHAMGSTPRPQVGQEARLRRPTHHQSPVLLPRHTQRQNPNCSSRGSGLSNWQVSNSLWSLVNGGRPPHRRTRPEFQTRGSRPGAVRVGESGGVWSDNGSELWVLRWNLQWQLH